MQTETLLLDTDQALQRVVVVGCCGAGKSTFAKELSCRLEAPYVERDALGDLGSGPYLNAVVVTTANERWVFDGAPYFADDVVYPAAQRVVWLDYPRTIVLWRAIRRSLRITFARSSAPGKGWFRLHQWIAPGGPRFANSVYTRRRLEFRQLQFRSDMSGKLLRFATPASAKAWLDALETS